MKSDKKIIAYHGTSEENHNKILKSGHFKKGTYFAIDIKDAKVYGGKYIFKVFFDISGFKGDVDWQFHLREDMKLKDLKYEVEQCQ